MPVETIPRVRWREFLDSFNRVHRGWLITVDSPTGAGPLMRDVPLASILFEDGDIVIETAMDRQHADHVVKGPVRLRLDRTTGGADRELEIVDDGGNVVRVRFRSAVRSELVDGAPGF